MRSSSSLRRPATSGPDGRVKVGSTEPPRDADNDERAKISDRDYAAFVAGQAAEFRHRRTGSPFFRRVL